MPLPDNYDTELDDFLYIMARGWGMLSEEHALFGFPFSYEKLLLFLLAASILCFAVRKCFFDD